MLWEANIQTHKVERSKGTPLMQGVIFDVLAKMNIHAQCVTGKIVIY
jgi:hypothetical protein